MAMVKNHDNISKQRLRNWCFTCNNYSIDDINSLINCGHSYLIFGKEIGEKGTPHLQGYIEFDSGKTFESMKKINNRCWFGARAGNQQEAINYCKKDGDFQEFGSPKQQGKRSDIEIVKEMVKENKNMKEIFNEVSSFQALKVAEIGLRLFESKRNWKSKVTWCFGSSGAGKSKYCYDVLKNKEVWWSGKNLKWWDGYDKHEYIVLDDFRADFCTFHELLRILDRYPYTIEVKGGTRQLLAKEIYITSIFSPTEIYKNKNENEDIVQLLRRIDHIYHFTHGGIYTEVRCTEVGGNTNPDLCTRIIS